MTINQLFLTKPPLDLIMNMMRYLDILTLQSVAAFSQKTIIQNNVIIKVKPILDELGKHYLPCKKRVYIDDITPKKLITVVKQCLRIYECKLISQEKYIAGCKQIIYRIDVPHMTIPNNITYADYSVSFE